MLNRSVILSAIFLSACTFPQIDDQPQRTVILSDCEEDVCRVRCFERAYHWGEDYVGPVGDVIEVKASLCSKLIGHDPDSYEKVADWYERVRKAAKKSELQAGRVPSP